MRNTIRRLLPYLLFAALVCAFLWRPIFLGDALLPGNYLAQMSPWNTVANAESSPIQWNPLQWDAIAQFYPWRVFYARSMREGIIPLWNPHQFCGTPFLANGQSAVLYPLNVVFLVFDPITAFTVYAALHLFLAASFMYLLLKDLGCKEAGGIVGGLSFAFCAFMVLWLELPTFVGAAVWLPLTLTLIQKAVRTRSTFYGMLAGTAQAMAFLAGHFQIAFYVAVSAGLWWLWKLAEIWRAEGKMYAVLRVVIPFLAFASIACLIAAPQALPTIELAQNSHRARAITAEGYSRFISNAVRPYRLVTAFFPNFYGNPSKGDYFLGSAADYMEYGLYVGILPLLLSLIAVIRMRSIRYAGFFALLALFAILTATGTPINYLFYYLIPGFSALGGPNRIMLVYFVGIAGLAGLGMNYVQTRMSKDALGSMNRFSEGSITLLASVLILATTIVLSVGLAMSFLGRLTGSTVPNTVLSVDGTRALQIILVSIAVACVGILTNRNRRSPYTALIIATIATDLFVFGVNYNPTCNRSLVYPPTELTTKLKQIARNVRIAPINPRWNLYKTPAAILPPNSAMVYGLYDVQGYDSLYTRAYKNMSSTIQGEDSSPIENGNMVFIKQVTSRLPEIATFFLTREPFTGLEPRAKLIGRWNGVYVYEMPNTPGRPTIPSTSNFSFRLGLFLGCLGIGIIAGTGLYRVLRRTPTISQTTGFRAPTSD
ncbi:MAG: YfhO family protein [Armatimonadetes bacterium]|nr:YfhO family protein [Armatimonadota bacterium]